MNKDTNFDIIDRRGQTREIVVANFMSFESTELTVITDVINMINDSKDGTLDHAFFEELLQRVGVVIIKLSDEFILIFKDGDPEVESILKAKLEILPEFLTSEDREVRLLAKWKLDALTNDTVNGQHS